MAKDERLEELRKHLKGKSIAELMEITKELKSKSRDVVEELRVLDEQIEANDAQRKGNWPGDEKKVRASRSDLPRS